MRLFFSWQDDDKDTKKVIRKALQKACNDLGIEYTEDTRDEVGGENIVDVLLRKIENSDIFAADITLVGGTEDGKLLINSNVAYELGFAQGSLGKENLLLLFNSERGDYDKMVFDLGKRTVTKFSTKNGSLSVDEQEDLYKEIKRKLTIFNGREEKLNLQNLDVYERTILFWAVEFGEGYITDIYTPHRMSEEKGRNGLAPGNYGGYIGPSYASHYFTRGTFDKKETAYFGRALQTLSAKDLIIKLPNDMSPPSHESYRQYVLTPEAESIALSINRESVKDLFPLEQHL